MSQKVTSTSGNVTQYGRILARAAGQPFLVGLSLLAGFVVLGVAGYMMIEGWSVQDALFMTVITITTIGYGEVFPLSPAGRMFTIVLIAVGVLSATYAISSTIELFTSQELVQQIRDRRKKKTLEQLNNHTIICGYGRLGRSLARELRAQQAQVLIIDPDPDATHQCEEHGVPALVGNGADDQTLQEAGIKRARALVAAANSDAENVFIVLSARSINPDLQIIARANRESSIPKLEKAGADIVMSPYTITGRRIANMVVRPNVVDFLDGVLEFGDHKMRLEEFIIGRGSSLAGLTLREARLKVAVLAVDDPDDPSFIHPNADTKLLPGTSIIVMGIEEELTKVAQMVGA